LAFYLASKFNNPEYINILLKAGANINLVDPFRRTLLMLSTELNFNTTHLLLQRGAAVNLRDVTGATALHYMVSYKTPLSQIIKLLLNYKADPLGPLTGRRTPLHDTVARRSSIAVGTLLAVVADINMRNYNSKNILHFTAAHADDAIISLLLNNGADLTGISDVNQTPLHSANGRKRTMAFLIRKGKVDIAARDVFGKTTFEAPSPMSLSDTFDTLHLGGLDNIQALEFLRTIEYFKREIKVQGL
jgi:ankyrin repeat protein